MSFADELPEKEARRLKILTKPILPLLIKMSVPTIIGMLIMIIYSLTDTFFVGILNNKSMTAAIGIVFSFVSIIQAVGFWFGYGSGNIMAKKIGAKQEREAEIIASIGISFSLVAGLLIAVSAWLYVEPLTEFIGGNASPDLFRFTTEYIKIMIITIPFTLYGITIYNQLRLCGNVKDGMIGLLAGIFSNMILDPVFMFTLKSGFIGAGYATLTGQIISVVCLSILAGKNGNHPLNFHHLKFSKERVYHVLLGGLPNFSRQAITSVALILLNRIAANFGDSIIAALTISSRVAGIAFMVMIGWGQGFQPICAMNFGAKKYDRVKSAFKITVKVGTVFLISASIILYVFAEHFISAMSSDLEVITIGVKILRLQCLSMPLLGYFAVSSMLLQNVGEYFWSLLISISRQGIFYIPLLYFLTDFYGEAGIYLLQPVADLFSFILAIFIIRRIAIMNTGNNLS